MFWCFYWSLTRDNDFVLAEKVTLLSQTQKQEGAASPGVKPGQTARAEREGRSGVSRWIIKRHFPFFLFLSCELRLLINFWSGHNDNYALIVFWSDKHKNESEGWAKQSKQEERLSPRRAASRRRSAARLNTFLSRSHIACVAMETDTPSLWDVPLQMDPAASGHQEVCVCVCASVCWSF